VADDLRESIAAALAAQVRRKQLNGRAPLMSDNYSRDLSDGAKLEIRTLLDGDCTDSHVHHVIMVARTIADLAGGRRRIGQHDAAEALRLTRGAREPAPKQG
jgi:predicted ATPase with chaperone activity